MRKYSFILLAVLLTLVGCKKQSVRYTIEQPEDQMHLSVSAAATVLTPAHPDSVALTFTWQWPELLEGSTGYSYYFKMDVADNGFESSIPRMTIEGENSVRFTCKQLNNYLDGWLVNPGEARLIEAEIIAVPEGMDHYVKPMISTVSFLLTGYAGTLFMLGTATSAGNDYYKALPMEKIQGEALFHRAEVLQPGGLIFVDMQSPNAYTYCTASVARRGHYHVYVQTDNRQASLSEQLYLIGSATPGGWSLNDASPLTQSGSSYTWTGVLSSGEMKLACNPASGSFTDAFYQASADLTPASGTSSIWLNDGSDERDWKWLVTSPGVYHITVDLNAATITFRQDGSLDDLPYKEVWIVGSAVPCGWSIGSAEKMNYDFQAEKGTFVWTGWLTEGELKFTLDKDDSWAGKWFMAPAANTPIHAEWGPVSYSPNGSPDNKFVVGAAEAGTYTISLNVLTNQVKFVQQ